MAPSETVAAAVARMKEKNIGSLIVKEGESVVGILTERDLLVRVLAAGRPLSLPVAEVMTSGPFCLSPETTVGQAMSVVTDVRIRHLPVVEENRLVGMVSIRDLGDWLVANFQEERERLAMAARLRQGF
ncbi:MAG: CBS domain-containing protein [Candidatus Competibacteraceae bacterium]